MKNNTQEDFLSFYNVIPRFLKVAGSQGVVCRSWSSLPEKNLEIEVYYDTADCQLEIKVE